MFRQMLMAGASRLYDPRDPVSDDQEFEDPADDADLEFDDGQDDGELDDPDDDADGDDQDDEQEGEPQQRQPTRGENRVARLAREARELRERAERAERERDEERRQRQAPPAQVETPQAREARLAAMTEAQRLEYLIREQGQTFQAQLAQTQFNTWDANDKLEFKALAASNPAVGKLAGRVEAELTKMRAAGQNASRETVAKYLLGELALQRAPGAARKGAREAAAGRERQQGRPTQGRSDAAPGRRGGDERAARRARLENMEI